MIHRCNPKQQLLTSSLKHSRVKVSRGHGRKLKVFKKFWSSKNTLWRENSTAPSSPPPPPLWVMLALHYPPFVWLCGWGGGRWAEWCAYPSEPARLHLWDGPLRLKQLLHPTPTAACQSWRCGVRQGQGRNPRQRNKGCQGQQSAMQLNDGPRDKLDWEPRLYFLHDASRWCKCMSLKRCHQL